MLVLTILMRLVHVVAGVCWAGGAFLLAGFVTPTVRETGPAGGQFMQRLSGKMSAYLGITAVLTTLSGIYLYAVRSGFRFDWITTGEGVALTIGALAGLAAWGHGAMVTGKLTKQVGELGQKMGGGPPKPELLMQMRSVQAKLEKNGRISAMLLLIAVIGMAVAEYL